MSNIKTYKKNDGKTYYMFRIRVGNKTTTRRGFKTKLEAQREYFNVLDKMEYLDGNSIDITFEQLYQKWLDIYKTGVKPSTLQRVTQAFSNHIIPKIGHYKISKLRPIHCQEMINELLWYTKGRELYNQCKRVMKFAMTMQYIDRNPFDNVILPTFKKENKKVDFLEAEDVKKLLDYVKNDHYWYTLFRLLIYTGIRRGECLALTWDDIDFKKNELSIFKSLSVGEDYQVFLSSTKTETSERKVLFDKDTGLALKKLKLQSQSQIVFPNKLGKHRRLSDPSDKLNKIIKATGIKKVRLHDLRHTHASLLFASGASAKEVQDRLGHKSIKTTMNIYTHLTKEKKSETLENFVKYMEM